MLSYLIRVYNIGFLKMVLWMVEIIFQASFAKKLKYTTKIIYQIHIFDIKTVDIELWKAYIANVFLNSYGLLFIFNQMDLLLKYYDKKLYIKKEIALATLDLGNIQRN